MARAPDQLLLALVTAILPEDPRLADSEREFVEQQVLDFVAAEIAALPTHLRWPYRTALRLFDLSALAARGRPFRALDLAKRRRYVETWADGSVELARDFIKLVRVCALLQFYDHPLVTGGSSSADAEDGVAGVSGSGARNGGAAPASGREPGGQGDA